MASKFLFALLVLYSVVGVAQKPVPQLPQTYIDTAFSAPTGVTRAVHTSASFQSALNSANPGDTIVLDAGATYQGNFTLPVKSNPNNKWIYIVGSALSSLPAPGTRVVPATDAANMPKIVSPGATPVFTIAPGANHYRFVGLEITSASTQGCSAAQNCYTMILVYAASVPNQPLVDSITVDRCYLHGTPTLDVREGVAANGSNIAVVDSYISDIHQSTNDSQAIVAYYSPGPIKIVNNYLEATGENIMFGGAGGPSNPWVPSDIEIRGNWLRKPLAWDAVGVTIGPGNKWVVKNILEIKSGRRVLIDGNTLENSWCSGQAGWGFALTVRTGSSGNNAVVDDVQIQNNIIKNVSSGFTTLAQDDVCASVSGCTNPGEMKRVVFYNNLFLLGDTTQLGYGGQAYAWGGIVIKGLSDFVLQHNTVIGPPNLGYCKASWYFEMSGSGSPTPPKSRTHNVWVLDNVLCRQPWGPYGYIGQSSYVLTDYMGDPSTPPNDVTQRFKGNIMYLPLGDKVQQFPPHNFSTDKRLQNSNEGEYRLNYPAKMETSDGRVPGVDKAKLASAYSAESRTRLPTRSEGSTGPPKPKQ